MKKQKNSKLNLKVKILSGSWKGRNISFLDKSDLRPTKNIIKETLFNWIKEDIQDSICIDMFAGSGSLGFEAASRGAKKVYMIDNNLEITNHLRSQKDYIGAKNISIINLSAFDFLKKNLKDLANVIFLDPPFSLGIIEKVIKELSSSDNLADKCKIYVEIPYNKKNIEFQINTPINWELLKSKKSGDVAYLLFQHNISVI